MAAEDLANMPVAKTDAPRTADDTLTDFDGEGHVDLEAVAREAARDAGVRHAAYINYDAALDAYANRSDVENLQHKYARNTPADFAEAAFMRTVPEVANQWENGAPSAGDEATEAAPVADDYDLDGTDDGDEV